ncbi:tRNA lysidine(34) synthetase TilS [Altererythrobacter sp. H2]|uniref:tRNA lysidine(34) synthetase TilS n=1 Tax=Altererythrobacter sp. H2 TaxID=3108391 RepID=UPI003A5CE075
MALLLLAKAAFPDMIEAATVDHGLRPESADEAALVGRVCASLAVPHRVLKVEVGTGNIQHRARSARYAALGGWLEERGLEVLLTAHQMDDQAETLVMRLNRGSGLRGLAGIRARTRVPDGDRPLLRPLLGWRRAELEAVVRAGGLPFVDDPSNADPRFDRVRVRQALAAADWLVVPGLARSAALLAEAENVLEFAVGREWSQCVVPHGDGFSYAALRTGLPGPNLVRIGVIQAAARALGGSLDTGEAAQMASALLRGQRCNIGGIAGCTRDAAGERTWLFTRENPRTTG